MCSSHSDDLYCIEIQGCFPKCSCNDWLENELPCKHIFHVLKCFNMTWHDLPEVFRFVSVHGNLYVFMYMCTYCINSSWKQLGCAVSFRTNPLFNCNEKTLHCHNSTYTTIGDVKDVDPKLLQGVLNIFDMNTQVPEKIEVLEDVKQDLGMTSTEITGTDVKDEIGTL